ncbi:MAG TPA: LLM class flavin-dependent oxidoreductase [Stellaceae bacterium]|nr:LLM class flavin-dependent oxidoreductase [Stellaceae bacterium]
MGEVALEFGMQFFPDVGPEQKTAAQYFDESLRLVDFCDPYGWGHVRTVEHYFHPYGGYSPNPIVFLTAASQRTRTARLITGAVLPIFNHPLKLAGEIGMLDAISGGRLEVGFARAFLPHEFARFGVSVDESKARFAEGMEQVRRLLEEEKVAADGQFHRYPPTTSLPRPTQRPRPQFWVAAIATPESFENAGRLGHWIMAIPMAGGRMAELVGRYREAWRSAGHKGHGRVMLAFHMFCHPSRQEAAAIAREPLNRYLRSLVDAASDWTAGMSSADYPGYDKIIEGLSRETFDTQLASGSAWVGPPGDIVEQAIEYHRKVGGFESASLQVNFNTLAYEDAAASVRLFSERVMTRFPAAT